MARRNATGCLNNVMPMMTRSKASIHASTFENCLSWPRRELHTITVGKDLLIFMIDSLFFSHAQLTRSQVRHCTELMIVPSNMSDITLVYLLCFFFCGDDTVGANKGQKEHNAYSYLDKTRKHGQTPCPPPPPCGQDLFQG